MNKHVTADNTLTELWAVKDETAARFRSAAEYLAHLGLSTQTRAKRPVLHVPCARRPISERFRGKPGAAAGSVRFCVSGSPTNVSVRQPTLKR